MAYTSWMLPIVIRPSGVWDSRKPLTELIKWQEHVMRIYSVTTLSLTKAIQEARREPDIPVRGPFFRVRLAGRVGASAWVAYAKSRGRTTGTRPTFREFETDATAAFWFATEHAVIGLATVFETFIQCWALNFLLTRLESGMATWSRTSEAQLARKFARVHIGRSVPSFPAIRDAIESIAQRLAELPHIEVDDLAETEVLTPVSDNLNGLRSIQFWREYRNLLIHNNGVISVRFYYAHKQFVNGLRQFNSAIPQLVIGERLKLRDAIVRTIATTHLHAARALNKQLVELSGAARGDVEASFECDGAPAALLQAGDHPESVRWTVDSSFRDSIRASLTTDEVQNPKRRLTFRCT